MKALLTALCVASIALGASAAGAQTVSPNGYLELARAAALLKSSRPFTQASASDASLAAQRLALEDRAVKEALLLLRRGLSRETVALPVTQAEPPLDDLEGFRNLARLLRIEEYVYLADGRVHDALLDARVCLRLGRAAQGDTLVHGLVGIAIGTTGIREVAEHLDQLSEKDCLLLREICLEWLNQPNPFARIMEGERRFGLRRLRQLVEARPEPGEPAPTPEQKAQLTELSARMEKRLDELYARIFDDLKRPSWEWTRIEVPATAGPMGEEDPAAGLLRIMLPSFNRARDSYVREVAQVQLLAGHAAVLRYRWQQHQLPASLDELGQASLTTDPFTGKPLRYERLSPRRYRLTSAGPLAESGDPNAVDGRKPVSLDD